ncbi:unnamed protein product [Chironomus riparius]|uniref:Protein kinase domain-containing protein n=1 Tax=Chironomus riparius TaxID=315576 RepID=A0A9N9WY79_9DIPT|nr:unnamed protein product [Chironomus riparius]
MLEPKYVGPTVVKRKNSNVNVLAPEGTQIGCINFNKELPTIEITESEYEKHKKILLREFEVGKTLPKFRYVLYVESIITINNGTKRLIVYEDFEQKLDVLIKDKKNNITNTANKIKYILQTASQGVFCLHNENRVLRNICPRTIAVCKEDNHHVGKISDLAMCKSLLGITEYSKEFTANDLCMAPEIYLKKDTKDERAVDIFSLGVVYFFALSTEYPFKSINKNKNYDPPNFKTFDYNALDFYSWDRSLAEQLISSMLQHEPSIRPTINQVLNHPFFWDESKIEHFFATASQYIQGNEEMLINEFNLKCQQSNQDWREKIDDEILHAVEESCRKYDKKSKNLNSTANTNTLKNFYKNTASDFLRFLRNFPKHIDEDTNLSARTFLRKEKSSVIRYFLNLNFNFFVQCYSFFNDFKHSKYDTLRKFYCDCYLANKFENHTCDSNAFNPYIWGKKKIIIKILNVELKSDEEKKSDAIIEQIKRKNEKIFGDFSIFQKFEHVVTVPRKNKGKIVQNKYNIICSTDPNTFKKIMEAKKIKFGFQQCNVVDGTYVPRCFRCYGFFHKAGDCDICDENENICIKCGGRNHKKEKCTAEVSCNNCTEYNKKNKNANLDVKHSIIDFKCPCYQKAFKSLMRSIDL